MKLWFLIAISVLCTRINIIDGDPLRPCNVHDGQITENEAGNCTFTEGVCQWKLLGWLSDFKGNSFSSAQLPNNSKRGIIKGTCTCPRGPQSHCLAFNYNATKDGSIDMVIKSNALGRQKRHEHRVEYIRASIRAHTELQIYVDGMTFITMTFISIDTIAIDDFHYFSKPCMHMSSTTVATTTSQKQRSKVVTVSVAESYSFNDSDWRIIVGSACTAMVTVMLAALLVWHRKRLAFKAERFEDTTISPSTTMTSTPLRTQGAVNYLPMSNELNGNNPDSDVEQSLVRMDYYNLQDDTRQTLLHSGNTSLISETDHPYLNETGLYSNEMHDDNSNRPMRDQGNTVYEAIQRRNYHIYTYINPDN